MALAAALPWKEILKAAPLIAGVAKKAWDQRASRPRIPPVDPAADLRVHIAALNERLDRTDAALAEQARVSALLAEQQQAIARRSARTAWVAAAALGTSLVALAVAVLQRWA